MKNVIEAMGNYELSPVFIGNRFFEDQSFLTYTKNDWKAILAKANLNAEVFYFGFSNVDSKVLKEQINSKDIPPQAVVVLSEIVALHRCLRSSYVTSLSPTCKKDMEKMFGESVANLGINYINPKSTPATKKLITDVLQKNGINLNIELNVRQPPSMPSIPYRSPQKNAPRPL